MKAFDPAKDIPSLDGKVVIVTGGNAGIGKATVRAIASHNPACIYLCARRRAAGEKAAAEISAAAKSSRIKILDLDLASLDSVRKCATEFNSQEDRLDLLFLNAGVANVPNALTQDGFEIQFGVNHVAHTLLTQLLMPKLLQTQQRIPKADVRIIATSSNAAFAPFLPKGGLALNDMRTSDAHSAMTLYSHSKLANVHFIRKLSQLYPNISATAAHPGFVKSDIWGKGDGGIMTTLFKPVLWAIGVDIDEGAKSQLWCATAPLGGKSGVKSGHFYEPVGKIKILKGVGADQGLTDELWEWTNTELSRYGGSSWPVV